MPNIFKNTNEWGQLSMKERADLIAIYSRYGYTSIDDIRKDYEQNRSHFINSDANFVQRLRNNDTRSIDLGNGNRGTHLMGSSEDDFQATIYPSIQESEGRLVNRENEELGGYYSAAEAGDTVKVSKPFAEYYTPRYKRDFQGFFEKYVPRKKTVEDMNEELIYDNRREDNNILAPGGNLGDTDKYLDGTQEWLGQDIDWYALQDKYPSIYKKFRPQKPKFLSLRDFVYNIGVNSQGAGYTDAKDILKYGLNNNQYVPTIYAYVYGPDKVYQRFKGDTTGFDYSNYIRKTGYKNVNEYNGLFNENNVYYIDDKNRTLVKELAKNGAHIYSIQGLDGGLADDVQSYIHKFALDKDGNVVVSDSDVYDFYHGDDYPEGLPGIEAKAMEIIGHPYILRQDNIPVKYGKYNYSEINADIDSLTDEDIARLTNSGYIEPSVVKANRFGGNVNRFDIGGPDGANVQRSKEGGYTTSEEERERINRNYDPALGFDLMSWWLSRGTGNSSRGEENEYWRAYLGLYNNVPKMQPNAKTSWDDKIEAQKAASGELPSDFYGTTPRMDQMIQVVADTLNTGNILRNYDEYKKQNKDLAKKYVIEHLYEEGKKVMENPGKWTQVTEGPQLRLYDGIDLLTNEENPLGMLANFGMMWSPNEGVLRVHDTYDFPSYVTRLSKIPVRPKEMKIRGTVKFDPHKGSILLRDGLDKSKIAKPVSK